LVETREDGGYLGRSYADAPEIDGLVHIATDGVLNQGDFCQVQVYDADEYDLYASPIR
jgi:ribosomal protein S12 methylthiotransferase